MLSGIYSTLHKNPSVQDYFSLAIPGMLLASICIPKSWSLFGYSSDQIKYISDLTVNVNLTDIGVGILQYEVVKNYSGEPAEFNVIGKATYVASHFFLSITVNLFMNHRSYKFAANFFPPTHQNIVLITAIGGIIEGLAKEGWRLTTLKKLQNQESELEKDSLTLASNYIEQAEYLYSGEEKTTKLKTALAIFKTASRISSQHSRNREKLNTLLRKENFDYV